MRPVCKTFADQVQMRHIAVWVWWSVLTDDIIPTSVNRMWVLWMFFGECRNLLPWPTNKRRDGTRGSHNPGECTACCCMSGCEFETTHGFADDNISLNSQNHKRPQRHLTCWEEQKIAMRAFKSCLLLYQLRALTYSIFKYDSTRCSCDQTWTKIVYLNINHNLKVW